MWDAAAGEWVPTAEIVEPGDGAVPVKDAAADRTELGVVSEKAAERGEGAATGWRVIEGKRVDPSEIVRLVKEAGGYEAVRSKAGGWSGIGRELGFTSWGSGSSGRLHSIYCKASGEGKYRSISGPRAERQARPLSSSAHEPTGGRYNN